MILRPYQLRASASPFEYWRNGGRGNPAIGMPTGCHAKGQKLLMFDGTLKAVEFVEVGDFLMGPDSTPRKVLSLCRGRQSMRRIIPTKGKPWEVNRDHILALVKVQESSSKRIPCRQSKLVVETLAEYENSSNWHKHTHKLYRVAVDFAKQDFPPIVDAYFLGLFLGDGSYSQSQVSITSMEEETLDLCEKHISKGGDLIRFSHNGSKAFSIHSTTKVRNRTRRTKLADKLDSLGLRGCNSGTKFIPQTYKVASRSERLKILAGLIDSDGSLNCGGYDFVSKSPTLAEDVCFIARSLGFAAYSNPCQKASQNGTVGDYVRVFISGNVSEIPVRTFRKITDERKQIKDVLRTGFKVEKLPVANYYGFELDGDHLYLLDDFTVTHNTGKSVVIADFNRQAVTQYPQTRILNLTHSRELIRQNHEKLTELWPVAPAGILSAGLNRKDFGFPITFGGIGSIVNHAEKFRHTNLITIDECHTVSAKESTMYFRFLKELRGYNPKVKVLGLSATLYRMGQGTIVSPDSIFTDICLDLTSMEEFNKFLDEGYLCPLIPRPTETELDVSSVRTSLGDYNLHDLQAACDKEAITRAAVAEMIEKGQGRKSWLVFASGIEHSIHVAQMLGQMGISAVAVHSSTKTHPFSNELRDEYIRAFKAGEIQALVNNGCFTTGFDHPDVDLIGVLRPTKSPGLWVQMLGRGTRPVWPERDGSNWHLFGVAYYPGAFFPHDLSTIGGRLWCIANGPKQNCLVLDFAGNTRSLGPVNDPRIPNKKKKGGPQTPPVKECEQCHTLNHCSVRFCIFCKAEFPPPAFKVHTTAFADELIARKKDKEPEKLEQVDFKVDLVEYSKHDPASMRFRSNWSSPPSLKVTYNCGLRKFVEMVNVEHKGEITREYVSKWWRRASNAPIVPNTVDAALALADTLKPASMIRVHTNKKPHPEVLFRQYE